MCFDSSVHTSQLKDNKLYCVLKQNRHTCYYSQASYIYFRLLFLVVYFVLFHLEKQPLFTTVLLMAQTHQQISLKCMYVFLWILWVVRLFKCWLMNRVLLFVPRENINLPLLISSTFLRTLDLFALLEKIEFLFCWIFWHPWFDFKCLSRIFHCSLKIKGDEKKGREENEERGKRKRKSAREIKMQIKNRGKKIVFY